MHFVTRLHVVLMNEIEIDDFFIYEFSCLAKVF